MKCNRQTVLLHANVVGESGSSMMADGEVSESSSEDFMDFSGAAPKSGLTPREGNDERKQVRSINCLGGFQESVDSQKAAINELVKDLNNHIIPYACPEVAKFLKGVIGGLQAVNLPPSFKCIGPFLENVEQIIHSELTAARPPYIQIPDTYLKGGPNKVELHPGCNFFFEHEEFTRLLLRMTDSGNWQVFVRSVLIEVYGNKLQYMSAAGKGNTIGINQCLSKGLFDAACAREPGLTKSEFNSYINKTTWNKRPKHLRTGGTKRKGLVNQPDPNTGADHVQSSEECGPKDKEKSEDQQSTAPSTMSIAVQEEPCPPQTEDLSRPALEQGPMPTSSGVVVQQQSFQNKPVQSAFPSFPPSFPHNPVSYPVSCASNSSPLPHPVEDLGSPVLQATRAISSLHPSQVVHALISALNSPSNSSNVSPISSRSPCPTESSLFSPLHYMPGYQPAYEMEHY